MTSEIIVPGNPDYHGTCITADTRPDPSHCWSRAATHIFHFHLSFFEKLEAAATCAEMMEAILHTQFLRQRSPVKWGWGKKVYGK